jgi:hypothetical protein
VIRFQCPGCQKALKAPLGSEGKPAHCPRCGTHFAVPVATTFIPNSSDPPLEIETTTPPSANGPTCSCPHCGRQDIPFAVQEANTVFQCAKCGGYFTPMGGAIVATGNDSGTEPGNEATAGVYDDLEYPSDRPNRAGLFLVLAALAVVGVTCIVGAIAVNSGAISREGLLGFACATSFIVLSVVGSIAASGSSTACPSCRRWWARTLSDRTLLDRKRGFRTVTRTDLHSGGYSGHSSTGRTHYGTTWGETQRQEQVQVLRSSYLNQYACKYCGHTWDQHAVEETENFNIN